jgi:hypothetical protein
MIWPYDDRGRLLGEDVWEPEPEKAEIIKLDAADVLTTAGTQGYVCLPTSAGASTASWTVNAARPEDRERCLRKKPAA